MFVFELPDEVIATILSSWVDTEFLAMFDTALCASEARPLFLTLIRQGYFIADGIHTLNTSPRDIHVLYFEWLVKRQVKVLNWVVYGDVTKLSSALFTKDLAGPHVRSLQLQTGYASNTDAMQSITRLVRAIPNLTDFRVVSFNESPINDESLQILSCRRGSRPWRCT
jgi:hypothetical protein